MPIRAVGETQGLSTGAKIALAGVGGVVAFLAVRAYLRHQEEIRRACEGGVFQPPCLHALAQTGQDIVRVAGPVVTACAPHPLSIQCGVAAGRALYQEIMQPPSLAGRVQI